VWADEWIRGSGWMGGGWVGRALQRPTDRQVNRVWGHVGARFLLL